MLYSCIFGSKPDVFNQIWRVGYFTFYCLPGLVPVSRLGKNGLAKCNMSASQVLNAPTYYTTLVANDALPDPTFCN